MRKAHWIGLALVGLLIFGSSDARAAVIWDWNFSGASGGTVANVDDINEAEFLAGSFLGFNDLDASGGITKGDTFRDYTLIRINGMTDVGGGNITPLTYGTGAGRDHEVTIKTIFSGKQTTDNTYAVTAIELFEVYFDFGVGFTGTDFFSTGTFTDTPLAGSVETGVLGGASGGTNAGPTAPDGTIDIIVALTDLLHTFDPEGDYFELDSATGFPLNTVAGIVLQGIFDANNLVSPPATPLGGLKTGSVINSIPVVAGYDAAFAAQGLTGTQVGGAGAGSAVVTSISDTANGAYDFGFHTRSDGSFVKAVTPEPASIVSWIGLCGIGVLLERRRRQRVAKARG